MRGAGGMSGAIARQLNFQPLSTTHVLETATFFRVREGGDLYPMGFVSLEHRTFSKKNRHETTISYLLDDGRDTCQATAAWIYLSLQRFETTWAKTKSAGAYNCVVKVSVGDFGICDPLCRALASLDQRWNLTKGAERPSLAMVYRGKAVDFLAKAKSPRRRRPRFLGYKD
jgi:hypothetical protein